MVSNRPFEQPGIDGKRSMIRKAFLVLICVFIPLFAASYEGKVGLDFTFSYQPYVGLKWHIANGYCMNPYLGFIAVGNNTAFPYLYVGIGNQFYLPPLFALDQYINVSPALYLNNRKLYFNGSVSYGLQYQFNNAISVFGELGIEIAAPNVLVESFRNGVGVIFYLK